MINVQIGAETYEMPTRPSEVSFDLFMQWTDGSDNEIIASALNCPLHIALKIDAKGKIDLLNGLIPLIEGLAYDKTYKHQVLIGDALYSTTPDFMSMTYGTFEKITFLKTLPEQLAQFVLGHYAAPHKVTELAKEISRSSAEQIIPLAFFFAIRWERLTNGFGRLIHHRPTPMQYKQALSDLVVNTAGITRAKALSAVQLN